MSIEILGEYGYNLGIAFQIVDDILDFTGSEEEMGKPIGSDLAQGTLTLPSMLLLEHYPEDNPVQSLFEPGLWKMGDKQEHIKQAIELIRNSSIAQECQSIASDYCARAYRNLDRLPDNSNRQALVELAHYVTDRTR